MASHANIAGMTTASCTWHWHLDGPETRLVVAGPWDGHEPPRRLWPPGPMPRWPTGTAVHVDVGGLQSWDARIAACLWEVAHTLQGAGLVVRWQGLQDGPHQASNTGLREVLDLGLAPLAAEPAAVLAAPSAQPLQRPVPQASAAEAPRPRAVLVTIAFFGDVLIALSRLLKGRSSLRAGDVLRQVDEAGPQSLPIVALTCALVGLMLAYMGGSQLANIGAPNFISAVVTVGMVRELAGIMTGVILAGRIGSAHAAALASMQTGEEIDALKAMGVEPIGYLVLPRLFALVLIAPAMYAFGAVTGVLAGLPAAVWAYGVPAAEYLNGCLDALTWTHLWIGIAKCELYAVLIALAGCREGLHAGRSAQAVGEATTRAVVKAIVWIVAAACGTTVVFQSLGF